MPPALGAGLAPAPRSGAQAAADPADNANEVDLSELSVFAFDQAKAAIAAGRAAAEPYRDRIVELARGDS